jgi:RNA polymerase sigma factor (TIGR02999 family)
MNPADRPQHERSGAGEDRVRELIRRAQTGDQPARDELIALLYDEFRAIAHGRMSWERPDHTLQATALVNEALRKVLSDNTIANATDRTFLLKAVSRTMDQVLITHARHRNRKGGPGRRQRMPLDGVAEPEDNQQLTPLDAVIERLEGVEQVAIPRLIEALEALDEQGERAARAALVVRYRFFRRWPISHVASELGISQKTVERDWEFARAWLRARLRPGGEP